LNCGLERFIKIGILMAGLASYMVK